MLREDIKEAHSIELGQEHTGMHLNSSHKLASEALVSGIQSFCLKEVYTIDNMMNTVTLDSFKPAF